MKERTKCSAVLLAIGAVVSMALASTASATGITSGAGGTPNIVAEAEGHVVLDNPISTINCASKVEGKVESHGEGVTASGQISSLDFTGCTNSWHVTVVSAGSLEVHHISGGSNGTLTSSGATVDATRFGITCRYATNNTDVGTLTAGEHATLDISAAIPFHSGSGLCGSGATTWTGSYKVTSPTNVSVDAGGGGEEEEGHPLRTTPGSLSFSSGTEESRHFVLETKGPHFSTTGAPSFVKDMLDTPWSGMAVDPFTLNCWVQTYGPSCTTKIISTASATGNGYLKIPTTSGPRYIRIWH